MVNAIAYAIVFVLVGGILFALLAPLLFPDADHRKLGEAAGPVLALIFGAVGAIVGFIRSRRRK